MDMLVCAKSRETGRPIFDVKNLAFNSNDESFEKLKVRILIPLKNFINRFCSLEYKFAQYRMFISIKLLLPSSNENLKYVFYFEMVFRIRHHLKFNSGIF